MEHGIQTNDGTDTPVFDNIIPGLIPDVGAWLAGHAQENPGAPALLFLRERGQDEAFTYAELDLRARHWAAWLLAHGRRGDRVLLAHAPGAEFLAAFFACQYAGMVAVPAYPPRRTRHGDRLEAVVADCGANLALADPVGRAALLKSAQEGGAWARLCCHSDNEPGWQPLSPEARHRPGPDDIAFLQYTSGSTGNPKGVMVSHDNLAHNIAMMAAGFGFDRSSVSVSWLPLFHDMGLILGALEPLAWGARAVLMAPNDFLQEPLRWLRAITEHRGTHTPSPNFAFDLCLKALQPGDLAGLDLSSWKVACNGAEPVRPDTLAAFERVFGPAGFKPGAFRPSYGMAENTLYISGAPLGAPWLPAQGHGRETGRGLVACGFPLDQRVVAVDPATLKPCPDGEVGELWVQGRSVAKGYWQRPAETLEAFGARLDGHSGAFLRTGDLGFLERGQVVVSGRLKDLVILRGVNHYPQDLERTAQECEADLKAGAAFAVDGDAGEALVLVQEVGRHPRLPLPELARRIAAALAEAHGVAATVALVPQGHVPKTSSGKLQRRACRQSWLDGRLDLLARWPEAAPQEAAGGDARAWALQRLRELGARAPEAGWDAPLAAWGLDSLRVTQFLAELQRRSGQKQALPEPADEPLGLLLSSFSAAPRLALAKSPAAPARRWPAHASMAGLWAAQQMAPGSSAYHIAWSLRLRGRPDAGRLQRALDALARQQASLRCAFEQDADGGLWQVDQGHGAALERPWSGPGPADQAQAWSQGWNQRPFDTSRAPLWRAALLPLDDGSSLLAFSFHHLIF
ncbi:MAG TPA: AMP-binding protein, partial [bacterium]|nr:AMP-binding protein [bacterium]